MKKMLIVLIILFGLGAGAQAQNFSFGAALGFAGVGNSGGVAFTVPLEISLVSFNELSFSLRADVGIVLGPTLALTANLSPLLTYTLSLMDMLPITFYAGLSVRLLVQDVLIDSRTSSWSFLGGMAGASASLGFLRVFAEANLSVLLGTPVFSVQAGLRF